MHELFIPGVPPDMPWYLELGVAAGVLTSAGIIWTRFLVPSWHAVRAAIKAAPEIVDGIEVLTDLVRGDVLDRLTDAAGTVEDHGIRLDEHDRRLDAHDLLFAAISGKLPQE